MRIKYEKAKDVEKMIQYLVLKYEELSYINPYRVLAVRSWGSKARAYARIWEMPQAWKVALEIDTFYVIEVLSENFDNLDYEKKEKIIMHELLHIPKTFSGALLPHIYGKDKKHIDERVDEIWKNATTK